MKISQSVNQFLSCEAVDKHEKVHQSNSKILFVQKWWYLLEVHIVNF